MSQVFSRPHVVVALVDEGSNPFELACLTEGLAIDRPEVGGLLWGPSRSRTSPRERR
ncbi:hypothetical protein [Saccharopolyspora tripterygii]